MNNRNRFRYRSYQEQNRWISRQRHDDYHHNNSYHGNSQDSPHGQRTFQSNRNLYLSRNYNYKSHDTNNYQSQSKRRNYYQNRNNRNRNFNSNYNYNYNYNAHNNKNRNYRYNYNYNYNNYNYNYTNSNRYYNYTRQRQYTYRRDNYNYNSHNNNYNQRRFRNNSNYNFNKRRASNNVTKSSKPNGATATAAVIVKRTRKSKYRKVSPTVSMLKNVKQSVLIPIMDDNSGAYKILLHSDYLQLICVFLNFNELLTKFVLLSKFYYVFIKSNDSGHDYVSRKIFDTCVNHTFPNFLNDMKIKGDEFKTNVLYQRNICKLLTNWKYFVQHQKQLGAVSRSKEFPWQNIDLCNLLSCSNCSIIIYWLKRVCFMTHLNYVLRHLNTT